LAKEVLIFLGIKIANCCQQVLKPLGSYKRVFTAFIKALAIINQTSAIADSTISTGHNIEWDYFYFLATGGTGTAINETLFMARTSW